MVDKQGMGEDDVSGKASMPHTALGLVFAAVVGLAYLFWGLTEAARSKSSTAVIGLVIAPFVAAFFAACGFVIGKATEAVLLHFNKQFVIRRTQLVSLLAGAALLGSWLGWVCWGCGGPDGLFYNSRPSFNSQTGDFVMSIRAGGKGRIYRFTSSGLGQLLTRDGDAFDPRVSRDGQFIVFALGKGPDNSEIWMMDVNGGRSRRITKGEHYDAYPVLSASGESVIFARSAGRGSTGRLADWDIFEAQVASGSVRQVTTRKFLRLAAVDLVPDSRHVIVSAEERGEHREYPPPRLYVVDLSSGSQRTIGIDGDRGASVSSPSGQIAFYRDVGDYNYEVFVMGPDGDERMQITHLNSSTHAPMMSPDGSRVIFLFDPARKSRFRLWEARLDDRHTLPVALEYDEP